MFLTVLLMGKLFVLFLVSLVSDILFNEVLAILFYYFLYYVLSSIYFGAEECYSNISTSF